MSIRLVNALSQGCIFFREIIFFTPLPPFVIIFFLPLSLRVFTHQISQTTIFSCFGIIHPFFFLIIMFLYNFLLIFPLFSPFLYIFFNFSLLFSFYFVIVLFYLSFFFSNIISEAFFLPPCSYRL